LKQFLEGQGGIRELNASLYDAKEPDILSFSSSVELLTHLKKLSLDMGQNCNPKILMNWCTHLKKLELSELKLNFNTAVIFDQKTNLKMASRLMKLMSLPGTEISDAGLSELQNLIGTQLSLKSLLLSLEGCKGITSETLERFIGCLSTLTNLESLELFLGSLPLTDYSIENLAIALKTVPRLRKFALSLTKGLDLTNRTLTYLQEIIESQPLINQLFLNFIGCSDLTDGGLTNLLGSVQRLQNLEELQVHLAGARKISDQGFSTLTEALKLVPTFTHLTLNIARCPEITDKTLISLRDLLLNSNVKYLELLLNNNPITDNGVIELCQGIKSLSSMTYLNLGFSNCDLTDQVVNEIITAVEGHKELNTFTLSLSNTKISSDNKNKITQKLSNIPYLVVT